MQREGGCFGSWRPCIAGDVRALWPFSLGCYLLPLSLGFEGLGWAGDVEDLEYFEYAVKGVHLVGGIIFCAGVHCGESVPVVNGIVACISKDIPL